MPFDVAQKEKGEESSWRIQTQIKRREARDSGIPYEYMGKNQVCLRADSDNPVYEKSAVAEIQ